MDVAMAMLNSDHDRPVNIDKPCTSVRHSELTRVGQSPYKSECPTCKKGLLLIHRDWNTFLLEEFDRCVLCGQLFQYLDIADLRKAEGYKEPVKV
jgi:hypothetical protein